jgi:hypothetical protein
VLSWGQKRDGNREVRALRLEPEVENNRREEALGKGEEEIEEGCLAMLQEISVSG